MILNYLAYPRIRFGKQQYGAVSVLAADNDGQRLSGQSGRQASVR